MKGRLLSFYQAIVLTNLLSELDDHKWTWREYLTVLSEVRADIAERKKK